jgi:hypothetical protein
MPSHRGAAMAQWPFHDPPNLAVISHRTVIFGKQVLSEHPGSRRERGGFPRSQRCGLRGDFRTPALHHFAQLAKSRVRARLEAQLEQSSSASNSSQDCARRTWEARKCSSRFCADSVSHSGTVVGIGGT